MGEVYRARDTRLDRIVAIKILPSELATDPALRERFDREARVLSSLSHPHICSLFDVGDHQGTAFLVMELLDGQTLEEKLRKSEVSSLKSHVSGLRVDEALSIAIQIASALDAAHRAGIVHRDLKPGNVMLTKTGAKLLDFGLAKASTPAVGGAGGSMLPTTPPGLTVQGTILGTFQYMAPEQIEGQEADARTDIFAFGAVLYEMLAGRKAFEGKSHASLIGAIMHAEPPPVSTLQPLTPPTLDRLVRKCLAKDPDERWQSAKDLHDELKWIAEAADTTAPHGRAPQVQASDVTRSRWKPLVGLVAGAIFVAAAATIVTWSVGRSGPAPARPVTRFAITLPPNEQFTGASQRIISLSPDGTRLVYTVNRSQGPLYLRALDQLDAAPIRNTDGGSSPFFSADGQWIAYWRSGQLEKVSITGGAPVVVCVAPSVPYGASWGDDDAILFGQGANEIWRVAGRGGTPEHLIKADPGQYVYGPQILPDGRTVLFTLNTGGTRNWDRAQIVVQSLDTKKRQVVMQGGHDARYLSTGHLAYVTGGTLFVVPFDVATLKVTGGPVPLVENVRGSMALVSGAAQFSVSRTGSLVYLPANVGERRTLVWVDRQGREEPLPADPRPYQYPRISPDATRLAVVAADQDNDIWIWEFARATMTRLTSTPEPEFSPLWSPDGRQLVFQSAHGASAGNVYRQAADGTGAAERLTTSPNRHLPYAFTADGKTLVFGELDPKQQYDLQLLRLEGDHASKPLLSTPFNEQNADLSPDGRWMVYQSNQSGQDEIYVRPFPGVDDGRWKISVGGGSRPVWARSGRELFYLNPSGAMMAVDVRSQSGFSAGNPIRLFEGSYASSVNASRHFDVAPDGKRFLMLKQSAGGNDSERVIVVQNWFEELKARVPAR